MQEEQPLKPANILNIVATNQGKRPLTPSIPKAAPLSVEQVEKLMAEGHALVDGRSSAAFGAGHVAGSYNVQQSSLEFEQRVGWVVPDDSPIILLTDSAEDAHRAIYNMGFIAMDSFVAGYLDGGIEAWMAAGRSIVTVPQMDVHSLKEQCSLNGLQVVDSRDIDEWDEGHIKKAFHMNYTSMADQITQSSQIGKLPFDYDLSIAVTCATGKRSSTAISLMLRERYKNLYNVTGGMTAWEDAGCEMLDAEGKVCNI